MVTLTWYLLLGHWIGDYVLQTNSQALNKKLPGKAGRLACAAHCLSYSIVMTLIIRHAYELRGQTPVSLYITYAIMIFISHYPLDRTHFIERFMRVVKGYDRPDANDVPATFYYNFISVILDNGFHLVFMLLGSKLVFDVYGLPYYLFM